MEVVQRVGDPDEDRGLRRLPKTRVLVEPPWDDVHCHIRVGDENVLSISHPLHFVLHPWVEVSRIGSSSLGLREQADGCQSPAEVLNPR